MTYAKEGHGVGLAGILLTVAAEEVAVVKSIAYLFVFSFVGLDISENLVREEFTCQIYIRTLPLRIVLTSMLLNHWYNNYYWVIHLLSDTKRNEC